MGDATRVVVLTRAGCHLCDEALAVVGAECARAGEAWRAVDIDADPELRARWTDDVPVVLVDGAPVARWRVSAAALRAALTHR